MTPEKSEPIEAATPIGPSTPEAAPTLPPAAAQDKLTVRMVSLAEIVTDAGPQVRSECPETVAEYADAMKAGASFPPITVYEDEQGIYIADGRHRIAAAKQAKRKEIQAEVRTGGVKDATWFGLGANKAHGLRLSAGDKANAVRLALREFPDKSHVIVAEHVGCSRQYVDRLAEQHATSGMLPRPERTVGRDGKSRPASRKAPQSHRTVPPLLLRPAPTRTSKAPSGSAVYSPVEAFEEAVYRRTKREWPAIITAVERVLAKLRQQLGTTTSKTATKTSTAAIPQACPHCGNLEAVPVYDLKADIHFLQCTNCYMQGPSGKDRRDATAAWNALSRREVAK